jgi:hypothetical protein
LHRTSKWSRACETIRSGATALSVAYHTRACAHAQKHARTRKSMRTHTCLCARHTHTRVCLHAHKHRRSGQHAIGVIDHHALAESFSSSRPLFMDLR